MKVINNLKFIPYQDLSNDKSVEILKIRNHDDIRKWMLTDVQISIENHVKFVKNLEHDLTKRYYAIFLENDIIGSASLIQIKENESAEFGFFSNPRYFMTNYGLQVFYYGLSKLIREFSLKKMRAGYFNENANAKIINHAFGFRLTGEKVLNNKLYKEIELDTSSWEYDLEVKNLILKIKTYKNGIQSD